MFLNVFLGGQRQASSAVFPVVAASNEVNTVIEVNSSTDVKKEATGSAAGVGLGAAAGAGRMESLEPWPLLTPAPGVLSS